MKTSYLLSYFYIALSLSINAAQTTLEFASLPVLQQDSSKPWENETSLVPNTPLTFKDIRLQEGTSCAYHSLKNAITCIDFLNDFDDNFSQAPLYFASLQEQLNNTSIFQSYMTNWASQIYNARKPLKKIDWLLEDELGMLLSQESATFQKHIVILTDQMLLASPELREFIPGAQQAIERLIQFKKSIKDFMVILWTNKNFNHWIAYLAIKTPDKTYVYLMNSIERLKSTYHDELLSLLGDVKPITEFTPQSKKQDLSHYQAKTPSSDFDGISDSDRQSSPQSITESPQTPDKKTADLLAQFAKEDALARNKEALTMLSKEESQARSTLLKEEEEAYNLSEVMKLADLLETQEELIRKKQIAEDEYLARLYNQREYASSHRKK